MPPYGLYPIPRHHLSPQNTKLQHRRTFNSMDFADTEPTSEVTAKTAEQRAQRKLEKRQRKEEKRLKKERKAKAKQQQQLTEAENGVPLQQPDTTQSVTQAETEPQVQHTDSTPVATPVKNGRFGPRGPYKKREKTSDDTPVSALKRKRESQVQAAAALNGSTSNNNVDGSGGGTSSSLLDPNFLSSLKEKMGDMGSAFREAEKEGEEPVAKKKRGRPVGSRKNAAEVELTKKRETPKGAVGKSAVIAPTPASSSKSTVSSTPASSRVSGSILDKSFKVVRTPVPVPSGVSTPASTKVAGSTLNKAFNMINTPVPIPSGASSMSACAKTPVLGLQKPSLSLNGSTSELQTSNKSKLDQADVLVVETPPSHMSKTPVTATPRQPAIPFPHLRTLFSTSKSSMVKGKGTTIDLTSPEEPTPAANTSTKHVISSQGSVNPLTSSQASMDSLPNTRPPAFTASTLSCYKQQLNEKPKGRPRRRQRAISEALSSSSDSTSTTQSVLDMLTRVPKPYGSTSENPFSYSKKKKEKNKGDEKHVEADSETFEKAFKVLQRTVNFTDEEEYLAVYQKVLEQSKKAQLPCLKSATGCSFRVHDAASSSLFSPAGALEKPSADTLDSTQRAEVAETFLRHAIAARVPVPLGRITGVWRLYCNEYTGQHVDKYSAGMRTLTITSPSSYQGTPLYTARLHIPPRSMAFVVAPFAAPPHAGFRATRMKLAHEGYAMEMVFFGNGYARVSADVGLLLSGKHGTGGQVESAGKNRGYGIWHFLAVHERPLYWEPEVDELEVEGRKLFAAYDGVE
ncbi:hypothetical protein J3E71DRAFT_402958 [Bipolaris maydis]|nr:hypothetical protein J3E73DRAFT_426457 [Bipolaris maydis]KAJ6277117.1 hypothetical protein J3E71DRAFT_402958 [Bipolaris maydis]